MRTYNYPPKYLYFQVETGSLRLIKDRDRILCVCVSVCVDRSDPDWFLRVDEMFNIVRLQLRSTGDALKYRYYSIAINIVGDKRIASSVLWP